MPTVGTFHTFYWEFSDTNVAPVAISRGGYPGWQASVIAPSLLGILGAWIDTWMVRLKWWIRFAPRVHRLTTERRDVLVHVLTALESPAYGAARKAVRETAVTLGFNRPEAWVPYSRALKASPGRAENLFRHVRACELTRDYTSSTLANPTVHLVTELAYHGFALHPKAT